MNWFTRRSATPLIACCLLVAAVAMVVIALTSQRSSIIEAQPVPERVEILPTPADGEVLTPSSNPPTLADDSRPVLPPEVESTDSGTDEEPLVIVEADILHVEIAAVGVDIAVSGETFPRQTENCKGPEDCIDPPVFNQAAWYGAVPSVPSSDTVRLFAHTSQSLDGHESFNNLPAIVAGDEIVVTTEAGVFTYRAENPVLVPYEEVPRSWYVWGDDYADRVLLITCNNQAVSATVVEGWLIAAELN